MRWRLQLLLIWVLECEISRADYSWRPLSPQDEAELLTDFERESSPLLPVEQRRCRISKACCLGSLSAGGKVFWKPDFCQHRDDSKFALYRYVDDEDITKSLFTMEDVILRLHSSNRKLIFAGDSITAQIAEGATCSWLRSRNRFDYSKSQQWTLFPGKFNQKHETVITDYLIKANSNVDRMVEMSLWRLYRPDKEMISISEMLRNADVFVMNWGLHWARISQAEDYSITMKLLFEEISASLDEDVFKKIFLWRETSAQHFFLKPGGEFGRGDLYHPLAKFMNVTNEKEMNGFDEKKICGPTDYFPPQTPYMWREHVVIDAAIDSQFHIVWLNETVTSVLIDEQVMCSTKILFVIPFYEMTRQLYFGHHSANVDMTQGECTHFCSTPFVWEYVYHYLFEALKIQDDRLQRCSI